MWSLEGLEEQPSGLASIPSAGPALQRQSTEDFRWSLGASFALRDLRPSSCAQQREACGCHGSRDLELVKALRQFVGIRSVSTSRGMRDECYRGAKFLLKLLESLGADVKMASSGEAHSPVLLARLGSDPGKPTVAFYGHYDVAPASEPGWRTKPFQLAAVDGYLYGRGTCDSKGPILAHIYAVKEMMDCYGAEGRALPVNVAWLLEGEELLGSRGLEATLEADRRWLEGSDMVVISNTQWVGEHMPCLTYGMRGMIALSIEVSGPERDCHSGNDGGVFREPMADLIKVLSTLVDDAGTLLVPGFYDGIREGLLDRAWQGLEHSEEFSCEGYQEALGVPCLTTPPSKRELLEARWCRPSMSVVDLRSGPTQRDSTTGSSGTNCFRFGPTRFSVIPSTAVAKVSVRYVPDQDAPVLIQRLQQHVASQFSALGSLNSVAVVVERVGQAWEGDPGSLPFKMAEAAISAEWGTAPLYVREGGTMPMAALLEKALGAPAVLLPLGQASDGCHLANERLRRANLVKGKNVVRRLLEEVAREMGPGRVEAAAQAGRS